MDEKLSDERAILHLQAHGTKWREIPDAVLLPLFDLIDEQQQAHDMGAAAIAAQKELVDALQAVMKQIIPHPRAIDLEDSSVALQRAFALMLKFDRLNKSESGFWWIQP